LERLQWALKQAGYPCTAFINTTGMHPADKYSIFIKKEQDSARREGYSINRDKNNITVITGADDSGVLYGCLELADRIGATHALPPIIDIKDKPEMVLRGACIGMQKTAYLPGRNVYEYPYTPQTFPWFYDKSLWIQYLDKMVANRMNSLYLWNGHPFASLVRLPDYPYAVEVDGATFKKNEDMFRFLTREADKRGIWVIQLFYNIIVSKPFAEKHNLKTQDRNRPIIPLIADYTRKSIAAFVQKYPNVGLMVTLGEAMEGVGNDDVEWFTNTIIPGVKDGLKALGKTDEPPIVLRAHDTDAPLVMKAAKPLYHNLYTEAKFNGEALTTWEPHGAWADLHRQLSSLGTVQIENVHIMANLEPFRYGAADFIRKCVLAMHHIYGANGLHLYPQASYWDWPYTADNTRPRLLEMERDWIWYAAWSRYAWNSHRDSTAERRYWSARLAEKYGCSAADGDRLLEAYEQSGEIAPKLLRRYGITDGNRQTLTLGMLMTQLINPYRFGLFTLLYESEGPPGEMLTQYAEKEWKHEPHTGETPVRIAADVVAHGQKAVQAIRGVKSVTKNKAEFNRLANDMEAYDALANAYAAKARAALLVLRYNYSGQLAHLLQALPLLQQSMQAWYKLAALTDSSYLYANSMQTQQRKIPVRGANGSFKTWRDMVPVYEKELANFKKNLDSLQSGAGSAELGGTGQGSGVDNSGPGPVRRDSAGVRTSKSLPDAAVLIKSPADGLYTLEKGQSVFLNTTTFIYNIAPELQGLKALHFSRAVQESQGTTITFSAAQPIKILIGFFAPKQAFAAGNAARLTSHASLLLKEPELETDASANDYGQAETKITNALLIPGWPPVNVHSYSFKAGDHTLVLAKGVCLVLGFIPDDTPLHVYDARLGEPGKKDLDWLFDN
jgi:hypothetical protein